MAKRQGQGARNGTINRELAAEGTGAATSRLRKPRGDKAPHCFQYERSGIRGEEKADKEGGVAKHPPRVGRAEPGEPVSRQRMENGRRFLQPSASFSIPAGLDHAHQEAEGEGGQNKETECQHGSGTKG